MKKTLFVFAILLLAVCLFSCDTEGSELVFEKVDGGVAVIGTNDVYAEEVVIPSRFDGSDVVAVSRNAFADNYNVRKIVIREGVREIGDSSFKLCVSLESVVLPSTLEKIGAAAFSECRSLTEISIPASVAEIGVSAFTGCSSLERITVDDKNEKYKSDGAGVLFTTDGVLLRFPPACETSRYVIPDGTVELASRSFEGTESLNYVVFPQTLDTVGSYAFFQSGIKEAVLPDSLTAVNQFAFSESEVERVRTGEKTEIIGTHAFESCGSLEEVYISKSVREIDSEAFYRCALKTMTVSEDNGYFSSDERGVLFNKDKTELIRYPNASEETEYVVPEGVTSITSHAFSSSASLEKITLPPTLTSYGEYAFAYCISLEEIINNSTVTDKAAYDKMFEND